MEVPIALLPVKERHSEIRSHCGSPIREVATQDIPYNDNSSPISTSESGFKLQRGVTSGELGCSEDQPDLRHEEDSGMSTLPPHAADAVTHDEIISGVKKTIGPVQTKKRQQLHIVLPTGTGPLVHQSSSLSGLSLSPVTSAGSPRLLERSLADSTTVSILLHQLRSHNYFVHWYSHTAETRMSLRLFLLSSGGFC
jgi:hypothetical protein